MRSAEIIWDLADEAPELIPHLPRGEDLLAALRGAPPSPPGLAAFADARGVRPRGHHRCFYQPVDGGVIARKGSEPTSPEFAAWVARMAEDRLQVSVALGTVHTDVAVARAEMRAVEKWALLEGKVPGAYLLREGLADARAAAAFQRAHVARYGGPARVPLPLVVWRWADDLVEDTRAALAPHLSPRARAVVDQELGHGLGAYAYFYPSIPHRLVHLTLPPAHPGFGYRARAMAASGELDVRVVVERWLELVARMLACGFVPKDPAALASGDCLQVQNAILDGGFADLDSLAPSVAFDERALADALRRTAVELTATISRLLVGAESLRLPDLQVHVWNELVQRLRADAPADARVLALLDPADGWRGVDRILSLVFP